MEHHIQLPSSFLKTRNYNHNIIKRTPSMVGHLINTTYSSFTNYTNYGFYRKAVCETKWGPSIIDILGYIGSCPVFNLKLDFSCRAASGGAHVLLNAGSRCSKGDVASRRAASRLSEERGVPQQSWLLCQAECSRKSVACISKQQLRRSQREC